jgi:hypothetical protein
MIRKLLNIVGGSIIFVVIISALYPFIVGDNKMESFCSSVSSGDVKTDLLKRAKLAHYLVKESDFKGVEKVLIIDSGAMGRYICEVKLEKNKVLTAKYVFND